jgi:hypothetical protein
VSARFLPVRVQQATRVVVTAWEKKLCGLKARAYCLSEITKLYHLSSLWQTTLHSLAILFDLVSTGFKI